MNVGFIGTGSMGGVLIQAFAKSKALKPEQIIIHNRSHKKAELLAEMFPGMRSSQSAIETTVQSDILFLCIKPLEFRTVLDHIASFVRPEQIIVSITSPVLIHQLEDKLQAKIAKVIPSITNFELSGATLCMYGSRMKDKDIQMLESLLSQISKPVRINEKYARITSDISSIGPAFMSFFLQQFIESAVEYTDIPHEEATRLAGEMLLGTGLLLTSGGFSPAALQNRVSVPGGITAKALQLLHDETQGVFLDVIKATHAKFEEDLTKVEEMMYEMKS